MLPVSMVLLGIGLDVLITCSGGQMLDVNVFSEELLETFCLRL